MGKGYTIQLVSNLTGVNPHTIRAWEKRYQAVTPDRDTNGRRLYQQIHIDKLKLLNDLSSLGTPISDLANLEIDELKSLYKNLFGKVSKTHVNKPSLDYQSILQNLLMALKVYKLDIISHELEKIKQDCGLRDFGLSLLSPLLQEVGAMCQTGQLTIAQEHALSAILKFHVGNILFDYANHNDKLTHNVIVASPEGEFHEFGILIASLLCKYYGVKFYYLGPNMPVESLIECAKQVKSEVMILGISKNMEYKSPELVNQYVEELSTGLGKTKLWVGGFSNPRKSSLRSQVKFIPTLSMLDYELSQFKK